MRPSPLLKLYCLLLFKRRVQCGVRARERGGGQARGRARPKPPRLSSARASERPYSGPNRGDRPGPPAARPVAVSPVRCVSDSVHIACGARVVSGRDESSGRRGGAGSAVRSRRVRGGGGIALRQCAGLRPRSGRVYSGGRGVFILA